VVVSVVLVEGDVGAIIFVGGSYLCCLGKMLNIPQVAPMFI
jgi:hypothetical protein